MSGTAITIVALIVLLLMLVIVVNVIQQQKERKEAERRIETARQKAIIEETEGVMQLSSKIPMSREIVSMMLTRISKALQTWDEVAPSGDLKSRIKDIAIQIKDLPKNYTALPEQSFQVPDNEKQAISILQGIKKLRLILRAEHNKGSVPPSVFVTEDKKIDRLLIRINLENLVSRATSSLLMQQLGSARQLLDKAEQIVAGIAVPDEYVRSRIEKIEVMREELREISRRTEEANQAKLRRPDEDDEFKQKKW